MSFQRLSRDAWKEDFEIVLQIDGNVYLLSSQALYSRNSITRTSRLQCPECCR